MSRKVRVGLVFGGMSGEHEVSLASARSVMSAINRERYEVVPLGITHDGRWLLGGDPMAQLTAGTQPVENSTTDEAGDRLEARQATGAHELVPGATGTQLPPLDVIFPVLHGPFGEDGTVQGLLDLAGLPYVGCGVLASAVGMDKIASRALFASWDLPQVAFEAVKRREWERHPDAIIANLESRLGYPVFVKPANLGSSIGISKARDRDELRRSLADAARYDRKLLVEGAVPHAREIECSVLGNDDPIASIPGEVVPGNEFYDYAAKYIDGDSALLIPAPLDPVTTRHIQELAVQAFLALDAAGLARVDFLMNGETGKVYLNEINTMPGFTSISMYPKLWEASGISYGELIERLIDLAFERHADRRRSLTTFEGAMPAT